MRIVKKGERSVLLTESMYRRLQKEYALNRNHADAAMGTFERFVFIIMNVGEEKNESNKSAWNKRHAQTKKIERVG